MNRPVLAAIGGYVVWTALWLGGHVVLSWIFPEDFETFQEGGDMLRAAPLLGALGLSVVCSVAAGGIAANFSRGSRRAVVWMAIALLITGIGVQAGVWSRMPVWYHLIFLALIVPVCVAAGRRRAG